MKYGTINMDMCFSSMQKFLIGVDPEGVARSSRIHEICEEGVMNTKNMMNLTHKLKGKFTHTRYTPVVLVGPIHQLN
jgi:hypothetical protein